MVSNKILTLLFIVLLLVACGAEQTEKHVQHTETKKEKPVSSGQMLDVNAAEKANNVSKDIVAKVNNSEITQSQLDYAMSRLLPKKLSSVEREGLSEKVLDSLINSRLMAVLEEAKLSEDDRNLLTIKVNAYREELLAKKYITENITSSPIPAESIHQYYLDHQSEFGGKVEKTFEVIQSGVNQDETERKAVLIELSKLSSIDDWSRWSSENKHLGISYKKATSIVGLLKEPLRKMVKATAEGETSPVLNEKAITIVRVTKTRVSPAKPFKQVSRKIRRMMAPQALKISIKDHLVELRKRGSIEKFLSDSEGDKPDLQRVNKVGKQ